MSQNLLKETIAENLPNLVRDVESVIQETGMTQGDSTNPPRKRTCSTQILVRMSILRGKDNPRGNERDNHQATQVNTKGNYLDQLYTSQ